MILTPESNDAESPHTTVRHVSELLDRRRIPQARALLASALAHHPDDAGLLFESARADHLEDNADSARETLTHLLRLDPHDVNARWLLHLVEMDTGQLAESEQLVLGLLRDHPEHTAFYASYSRLMLRALNFDKARALADEALRRSPDSDAALRARAMCDLIDGASDNHALGRLVAADPGDGYTLRLVVSALLQRGRTRQAHRLAQELLRAQPNDPELLKLVKVLRAQTHWSMLPLWPLQRWGWGASIGLWAGALLLMQGVRRFAPDAAGAVGLALLAYVVYSWIWPPLLRRWIERH